MDAQVGWAAHNIQVGGVESEQSRPPGPQPRALPKMGTSVRIQ